MMMLVMIVGTFVLFVGLSRFNQNFNERVDYLASELIKRKFNTVERDLVEILDAKEMNAIPFDTNRFRIVVSTAGHFNNEYFFLVTYRDVNSTQRKVWVRIEFLFQKVIAYEEKYV